MKSSKSQITVGILAVVGCAFFIAFFIFILFASVLGLLKEGEKESKKTITHREEKIQKRINVTPLIKSENSEELSEVLKRLGFVDLEEEKIPFKDSLKQPNCAYKNFSQDFKNQIKEKYPDGFPTKCTWVKKELADKLKELHEKNKNWRVTEAFPPTTFHRSLCHYTGDCVDIAIIEPHKVPKHPKGEDEKLVEDLVSKVEVVFGKDFINEYKYLDTPPHLHLGSGNYGKPG